MEFARLYRHRSELRSDFRRYYGIDFDSIGIQQAADLAVNLPLGSATLAAEYPRALWTNTEWLLADCVDALNSIVWLLSDGIDKPEPIPRPGMPSEPKNPTYTVDEYERILSLPRTEITNVDERAEHR